MSADRSTVRLGLLGVAHDHAFHYCRAWQAQPALGMEVVAGWDHADERQEALARLVNDRESCPQSLLARSDIDAVLIAAETSRHAELVEWAAQAGKAIILQKPLALTLDQADRIVAAVASTGVPFTLAWQMRVDPQNLAIREMLRAGTLGQVFQVRRRHGLSTHQWPDFASSWHVNPDANRDIWADDACHAIDFLYWLLGEPESVTAELASLFDPKIPMDNGIAVYRYAEGTLAEVVCSFTCLAAENTTEIIGEHGTIVQNFGDGPSCNERRDRDAPGLSWYLAEPEGTWYTSSIATPRQHGERIAALAGPLADFLHGHRGPIATAAEGRAVLRMTLACYEASALGRRVRLQEGMR